MPKSKECKDEKCAICPITARRVPKKGKKILRSACVWHVLKQAVIQKFVKTNTSLSADELYNRISQYTGKWASARKLKVVGEAGSIEYQF